VSAAPVGAAELDAAVDALDQAIALTAEGRAVFDGSRDRQPALTFLWVNIGSLLKQYCRKLDIPLGTEPLSAPIKMRDKIAYGPVAALSTDIIWETCVQDAPTLRGLIADLREAL
jgi:hypothetical protein